MIEGDNWYLLHLQEELIGAFPKASTNKDDIYVVGGKYGMTRQEIFDLGFQNEEFGNAVFRSDLGGDFMKYTVRRGQGEAAKVIATGMDLAMPLPPILTLARGMRFARSSTAAARLSSNAVKVSQQLASEAQMSQAARTIISNLRSGPRLAQRYGGRSADWVKKSSSSFMKNGRKFETHWYQNVSTGQRVEFKTKLLKGW